MKPVNPQFEIAFNSWFKSLQEKMDAFNKKNYPTLPKPVLERDDGNRYVRVWKRTGQRMCYCFIDKTNGDVLKSATWKAPAKIARGNIFNDDNGLDCCDPYGVQYIRGPNIPWR